MKSDYSFTGRTKPPLFIDSFLITKWFSLCDSWLRTSPFKNLKCQVLQCHSRPAECKVLVWCLASILNVFHIIHVYLNIWEPVCTKYQNKMCKWQVLARKHKSKSLTKCISFWQVSSIFLGNCCHPVGWVVPCPFCHTRLKHFSLVSRLFLPLFRNHFFLFTADFLFQCQSC